MKQLKNNSYNSTPHSFKENICPNIKYRTFKYNQVKKSDQSPSIKTDSEFSAFRTINVLRPSQQNSIQTKSRYQVEEIIENISNNNMPTKKNYPYVNKSFIALLSMAVGKESMSINEAIEKCEQFEISCKDQLISLLQKEQTSRQWPLPLSNMLLTDLGQLKMLHLCSKLQKQQDLNEEQYQIVEFLIPKQLKRQILNEQIVFEVYNQFRNQIDQKFNIVDELVQQYTLKIQPKIKKIKDKILLIKIEKKLKNIQKLNKDQINFLQFKNCLSLLNLKQEELLTTFRYLYFIQYDQTMPLVDRKSTIRCSTCMKEILQVQNLPLEKYTVSILQNLQNSNNQIIGSLLEDKAYLLQENQCQQRQIQQLKSKILMMELQNQRKLNYAASQNQKQLNFYKNKYLKKIDILEKQNEEKDNLIRWYKNELLMAVEVNCKEIVNVERHLMFKEAYKQIKEEIDQKQSIL